MIFAREIIDFWFSEIERGLWFRKDPEFDALIRDRFLDVHRRASRCELSDWRNTGTGRLAEILVLDQFSRNLYRDDPMAFAQDSLALGLAQEAVRQGLDQELAIEQRAFLYLPYMHSESLVIHEQALRLFSQTGLENNFRFEVRHHEIIQRFGRFPHRNRVLNRLSTAEEIEFLKTPGSSF